MWKLQHKAKSQLTSAFQADAWRLSAGLLCKNVAPLFSVSTAVPCLIVTHHLVIWFCQVKKKGIVLSAALDSSNLKVVLVVSPVTKNNLGKERLFIAVVTLSESLQKVLHLSCNLDKMETKVKTWVLSSV